MAPSANPENALPETESKQHVVIKKNKFPIGPIEKILQVDPNCADALYLPLSGNTSRWSKPMSLLKGNGSNKTQFKR
ncbi:hypothetical protein RO3G_05803 [Rhizopus delemar RA 99-880]|uniref:Uncharacterized protein n=1 Tax=Rhizopus delemar (strain RA 99-880 / ATCC MYA-4621 / FGSC 9543 / NRRL 43880) TaxID=246409 RepID=I1BY18_RHIO9|nr:hypothetical protein RO3G_05803 [Rhizopus delemar RA 99-880]|eukprot:EIE81098.1 hypothetical protein RO3G_05803 [Rhizopus delemar RA 99-880]